MGLSITSDFSWHGAQPLDQCPTPGAPGHSSLPGKDCFFSCPFRTRVGPTHRVMQFRCTVRVIRHSEHFGHSVNTQRKGESIFVDGDSTVHSKPHCLWTRGKEQQLAAPFRSCFFCIIALSHERVRSFTLWKLHSPWRTVNEYLATPLQYCSRSDLRRSFGIASLEVKKLTKTKWT